MRKRGEFVPTDPNADIVELDDSFWANAKVIPPLFPRKTSVHLRLDQDVLDWFKRQGKGHLTRMNAVLKAYVYAQVNKALRAAVAHDAKRKRPSKSGADTAAKKTVKTTAKRAAARARQHRKTTRP